MIALDRPASLSVPAALRTPVMYPRAFAAYIGLSAADVLLTSACFNHGAYEANVVAGLFLRWGGEEGMAMFKFSTVMLVLLICQLVGRERTDVGRGVVHCACFVSALPVTLALFILAGRPLL
ncbi:MAG: hypothetical protein IBJ11_08670 [Phycisphaerales bacterium]|nr:hypothetical protein [Phycisphaerales bacterium]